MWLIVCSAEDTSALWAYEMLKARGLSPLELVTADSLLCSLEWEHRVGNCLTETRIRLPDGRMIESNAVLGVINRITSLPEGHLLLADDRDRQYAVEEFYALFMSWLRAFPCPVLNRPAARGLSGSLRSALEWRVMAARAGLPVLPFSSAEKATEERKPSHAPQNLMVIGDHIVGNAPQEVHAGCQRLAQIADVGLLQLQFMVNTQPWQFVSATPLPDLCAGGPPLIDALYDALGGW
jgi:hypothetical protein